MTATVPTALNPEISKPYCSFSGNDLLENRIYDYGFRDYSPVAMRFTTVDPIRSGSNWYSYVGNDPINYIDPFGLREVLMNDIYGKPVAVNGADVNAHIEVQRNNHTAGDLYTADLSVKIGSQTIFTGKVQSEADHPLLNKDADHVGKTVDAGTYKGTMMGKSPSYDNPILLENKDLGVNANDRFMIHPDEFTNPDKIAKREAEGRTHHGPWGPEQNEPRGLGCQIPNKQVFDDMTQKLQDIGYKYGSDDNIYLPGDDIDVVIKDPLKNK